MNTRTPVLQVRHRGGDGWYVAVTWPDGRFEEVDGFRSESDANGWVAESFLAWLDENETRARAS